MKSRLSNKYHKMEFPYTNKENIRLMVILLFKSEIHSDLLYADLFCFVISNVYKDIYQTLVNNQELLPLAATIWNQDVA